MKMEANKITEYIIGAAIDVHKELGPGLLESAYQRCLAYELRQRGLEVKVEHPVPVTYKEVELDCGYRLDLLVNEEVIVETKTVERIHPIHEAQLLSYLKLMQLHVGLLLNFQVYSLKDGIRRIVREYSA